MKEAISKIEKIPSFDSAKNIMLALDSDPKIYTFKLSGYSIYFMLRFQLEQKIYGIDFQKPVFKSSVKEVVSLVKRPFSKIRQVINDYIFYNKFKPYEKIKQANILVIGNSYQLTKKGFADFSFFNYYDFLSFLSKIKIEYNYFHVFSKRDFAVPPFVKNFYPFLQLPKQLSAEDLKHLERFLIYISEKTNLNFTQNHTSYSETISVILGNFETLSQHITKTDTKLVCGISIYSTPWILMACEKHNIKSLDLQHGPILPSLVYYQTTSREFIGNDKLLFPTYQLTLGEKWTRIFKDYHFIWNENNTFTIGSSFYELYLKEKQQNTTNGTLKKILVLSQPYFYSAYPFIKSLVLEQGQKIKALGYTIVVRPHPAENTSEWLALCKEYSTILSFSDSRSEYLHKSFIDTSVVVGIASTGIYEANAFGIPVLIPECFSKFNLDNAFLTFHDSQNFIQKLADIKTAKISDLGFLNALNEDNLTTLLKKAHLYE